MWSTCINNIQIAAAALNIVQVPTRHVATIKLASTPPLRNVVLQRMEALVKWGKYAVEVFAAIVFNHVSEGSAVLKKIPIRPTMVILSAAQTVKLELPTVRINALRQIKYFQKKTNSETHSVEIAVLRDFKKNFKISSNSKSHIISILFRQFMFNIIFTTLFHFYSCCQPKKSF